MRLIDADELNEKLERSIEWCRENLGESKASFQSGCIAATKDIINTVLFSKSVDAVTVVRCKDCKYCHAGYCENSDDLIPHGNAEREWENWFCADGERKGGDE